MTAEKQIAELVQRLQSSAGEHLQSVVLYGSAASPDFHEDFSDVNVLCVLHESSLPALQALAPVVKWWVGLKHPAPMLFTRAELERSADIFAIEMLDIQKKHRVLLGEDLFTALRIPMNLHHVQVEHELRTKGLLLRQHYAAVAGDKQRVVGLMLKSVSSFITLFRHALLATGNDSVPLSGWREVLDEVKLRMAVDVSSFHELLQVREKKVNASTLEVHKMFGRYLNAIEKVTANVDEKLAGRTASPVET